MKLLAAINDEWAVWSCSHYDYRAAHDLMMDGGQPHCPNYAGYNRSYGPLTWIEVPGVTFADLYNDYNKSGQRDNEEPRKYGIAKRADIRVLEQDEIPVLNSNEIIVENFIWGTRGKDGKQPFKYILLKDAETSHLEAILDNCHHIGTDTVNVIEYILKSRKVEV